MSFTKVYPHKDQVEIEINNLVPFARRPLKLFRGRRLTEMVDSIRIIGIYQPITVRPVADGKYEILNGHYRVAAAMELKLNTVPAVILEGLTDAEALLHVSETNTVGLLLNSGIDIHDDGYKESEEFKKIENARIFSDHTFSMALDEYIERFLLTDFELISSHESIYDMGNSYELDEEECEDDALALEILRMTDPVSEEDIKKWIKSKERSNIIAVKNAREAEAEQVKELIHTFTRQDGGYVEQLRTHLNLDLDSFDYNNIRNKQERAKVLYFLHGLKTRDFPNVNILELLSKPSMENIDNSFLGWETSNGKIIKLIKHLIEKEISLNLKNNIKGAVSHVVDAWGSYMDNARTNMDLLAEHGYEYDFDSDISLLKSEMEEPHAPKAVTGYTYSPPSPLETLYLKLVQHEYLGQVKDLLMLHTLKSDTEYHLPSEHVEEMMEFCTRKIGVDNFDAYFQIENIQKIAKFVYLNSDTNKEDRRRIRESKEKVLRFLDFCFFADLNDWDDVSELLIISCLQAILLDIRKETFDYAFHGFEGKKGDRKGKIYVQAALKNDKRTYDALQVYWVHKVMDHSYANIGRYDLINKLRELEKLCCGILEKILCCPTIEGMLNMHSLYYHGLAE